MTKRNLIFISLIICSCFLLLSGSIVYLRTEYFNPVSVPFFLLSGVLFVVALCVLLIKNKEK